MNNTVVSAWAQWFARFFHQMLPWPDKPRSQVRMSARAGRSLVRDDIELMEEDWNELYTRCHEGGEEFGPVMVELSHRRTLALAKELAVSASEVAAIVARQGRKDNPNG